jgi:hypothetical protein
MKKTKASIHFRATTTFWIIFDWLPDCSTGHGPQAQPVHLTSYKGRERESSILFLITKLMATGSLFPGITSSGGIDSSHMKISERYTWNVGIREKGHMW